MDESAVLFVLTFVAGVMDLDILESPGTGVTEDSAVHRDMTVSSTLTPGSDHPQCPRRHAVDGPVCVAVVVADGDGESAIVSSDDVEVEAWPTGDVQPAVLAGVVSLVVLTCQWLCNRNMVSPGT